MKNINLKRIITLIGIISIFTISVYSQDSSTVEAKETLSAEQSVQTTDKQKKDYCPHEFSIWGGGGLSMLYYDARYAEEHLRLGGSFGLGYTWFFAKQWGIGFGAEVAAYNGDAKLDKITNSFDTTDPDGDDIIYYAQVNNYREKQRLWNLNVPVSLTFQTNGKHKFYTSLGFKLGVPVHAKYQSYDTEFKTHGYQKDLNVIYYHQTDLGYGTFNDKNRKGNLDLGLSYMGTVELGMKWNLSQRLWLYTGIYADYTFNNVMKGNGNDAFIVYNEHEPWNFHTNSILTSAVTHQQNTERFTDKLQPMAVGLKLKLGINLCKIDESKREKASRKIDKSELEEMVTNIVQRETRAMLRELRRSREQEETIQAQTQLPEENRTPAAEIVRYRADMDNFNLTISRLSSQQRNFLMEIVDLMRENENIRLQITGHTCDLGSDALNMRLGQERADSAKEYLVQSGIRSTRITTLSKGKTEPIYPNNNETNRRKNRRLEFKFFE